MDDDGPCLRYYSPKHTLRIPLPDESLVTTRNGNAVVIAAFTRALTECDMSFMRLAEGLTADDRQALLDAIKL